MSLSLLRLVLPLVAMASAPVKLIIDTDIGGGGCKDVDDVAAVCIAHALVDNEEAELLAIVQDTSPPQCAGVISVLNHYYDHDEVAIGAYKGTDLLPSEPLDFVPHLVNHWPSPIKNASQVPDAVEVYRRALASSPDHSVVISSIGLLMNLAALLRSPPDAVSPLSGRALLATKVKLLAIMGGKYPSSGPRPYCNFNLAPGEGPQSDRKAAAAAAGYVAANMPPQVQTIWVGIEVGIQVESGARLTSCAPASNPCRQAYIDYGGPDKDRFSWDPLTTLLAVRGVEAVGSAVCTGCDGVNAVDGDTGSNNWVGGAATNQSYIVLLNATAAGDALDDLLCQVPKHLRA